MKRHLSTALAVTAVLALGACAPAAPEMNAAADISAVNALRASFVKAFNAGDAEGVANTYTANAVGNTNHQPPATGHDAILASHKALFAQMTATIELMPEETKTMGTWGYDRGRFKTTMTTKTAPGMMAMAPQPAGAMAPKPAAPVMEMAMPMTMTDEGRYLVMLEKGADGAWKVSYDINNSTVPMPMPAPPSDMKGKGK